MSTKKQVNIPSIAETGGRGEETYTNREVEGDFQVHHFEG